MVTNFSPFNSQKRFTSNFSLEYPLTVQQTGHENTKKNQLKRVVLILHQIPITCLQGNVHEPEGRITTHTMRVERL